MDPPEIVTEPALDLVPELMRTGLPDDRMVPPQIVTALQEPKPLEPTPAGPAYVE